MAHSDQAAQSYQNERMRVKEAYALLTQDPDDYEEEHEENEEEDYKSHEEAVEELREEMDPLSIEVLRCVEIQLEFGGSSSGYTLFFTKMGRSWEVTKGYFWYTWAEPMELFWLSTNELDQVVEVYSISVDE